MRRQEPRLQSLAAVAKRVSQTPKSLSENGSLRLWFLVRERGLEPPRPCGHKNLNLARLPFRHSRKGLQTPDTL